MHACDEVPFVLMHEDYIVSVVGNGGMQALRIDAHAIEQIGFGRPAGAAAVAAIGGVDQCNESVDVGERGKTCGEWHGHATKAKATFRIAGGATCLRFDCS